MLIVGGVFLEGQTLQDFALALFIGLLLGTYSSIFVAAPLLVWLKERDPQATEVRRGASRRASLNGSDDATGALNGSAPAAVVAETVFEARPRKKKRR